MEITIFKDVTTEDNLLELEDIADTFTGLVADMNNAEDRRFVKEKASLIQGLLKKVDRTRIDVSKNFKSSVDAEAASLIERLNNANKPFATLIENHKTERAEILKAEKEAKEAILLKRQLKLDHAEAIEMNIAFDADLKAKEEARLIYEENIRIEAVKAAKLQIEKDLVLAEEKRLEDILIAEQNVKNKLEAEQKAIDLKIRNEELALEKREADKKHTTSIKTETKLSIMEITGISEKDAIKIIKAIDAELITNLQINY